MIILGNTNVSRNHSLYHVTSAESYISRAVCLAAHTSQTFSGGRTSKIPMAVLSLNRKHALLLVLLVVADATTDGADMTECVGEKGEKVTLRVVLALLQEL